MNRFFSYFLFYFDYADVFRFPLTLTMNQAEKTATYTGKFLTLSIAVYIVYSIIVSNMVNRSKATSWSEDLAEYPRPSLYFEKSNFTMAIGVNDEDNVFHIDETVYSLVMRFSLLEKTTKTLTETAINLKACTQADFLEDPQEFLRLNLNGSYCLPDELFRLNGFWDQTRIEYFYFELRTCRNSSENPIICKSTEEINNFLSQNYFQFYVTDHIIEPSNRDHPISRTFHGEFRQIDPNISKNADLYLKEVDLYTDTGIFSESWAREKTYRFGSLDIDFELRADQSPVVFTLNVYPSNIQSQVFRQYQKFSALLAQLGGICNFLFLIGFVISKFENKYNIVSILSNELFIFPTLGRKRKEFLAFSEKSKGQSLKLALSENKPQILNLFPISPQEENNSEPIKKISDYTAPESNPQTEVRDRISVMESPLFTNPSPCQKRLNTEFTKVKSVSNREIGLPLELHESQNESEENRGKKNEFEEEAGLKKEKTGLFRKISQKKVRFENKSLEHYQNLKKKENKFHLGFWRWVKYFYKKNLSCFFHKLDVKEKLYEQSESLVNEEMDILHLLKRVQDVEKLKRVLLNEDQLFFFDLLSKPMVVLKKGVSDERFRFSAQETAAPLEKEKILEKLDSLKQSESFSVIDRRILRLLDEDVGKFLKNESVGE